eukprot:6179655-Pleurochrysis_carterae.AAC.1
MMCSVGVFWCCYFPCYDYSKRCARARGSSYGVLAHCSYTFLSPLRHAFQPASRHRYYPPQQFALYGAWPEHSLRQQHLSTIQSGNSGRCESNCAAAFFRALFGLLFPRLSSASLSRRIRAFAPLCSRASQPHLGGDEHWRRLAPRPH